MLRWSWFLVSVFNTRCHWPELEFTIKLQLWKDHMCSMINVFLFPIRNARADFFLARDRSVKNSNIKKKYFIQRKYHWMVLHLQSMCWQFELLVSSFRVENHLSVIPSSSGVMQFVGSSICRIVDWENFSLLPSTNWVFLFL